MKKVTFIITDEKPPYFEYKQDNITQKGYFNPNDGRKILDTIKNEIFSNQYNPSKKNWTITPKNVLAIDVNNNSIIIKIPCNSYYIPCVVKDKKVFKIVLPNIVAAKIGYKIYYYWTEDDFDKISIKSTIFKLNIPHLYSDGSLCVGDFKEQLDWMNPEKYFVDLLTYPVSHANEIQMLRDIEESGYDRLHTAPKEISDLI